MLQRADRWIDPHLWETIFRRLEVVNATNAVKCGACVIVMWFISREEVGETETTAFCPLRYISFGGEHGEEGELPSPTAAQWRRRLRARVAGGGGGGEGAP